MAAAGRDQPGAPRRAVPGRDAGVRPHGLEVLRQPLEDRTVTISRAQGSLTFPANFMLVGAQNPCPCGYFGDRSTLHVQPDVISRYQKRISGPLLDRIDIHVEVPRVPSRSCGRAARRAVGSDPGTRGSGTGAPTARFAKVKDGQAPV